MLNASADWFGDSGLRVYIVPTSCGDFAFSDRARAEECLDLLGRSDAGVCACILDPESIRIPKYMVGIDTADDSAHFTLRPFKDNPGFDGSRHSFYAYGDTEEEAMVNAHAFVKRLREYGKQKTA